MVVEQVIDRFGEDGLRGPTAVANAVQSDRGRVIVHYFLSVDSAVNVTLL